MPDLGKYADAVLSSYAISFVLIAGLILLSIRRGRIVRRELEAVEQRKRDSDG